MRTRVVFLPAALLTVSLSLHRGLLNSLGFTLQEITATMAAALANVVGVSAQQSGVHLFVGSFHFVVTQACSGMDSLLALLCLGLAFVGPVRASLARRAALVALILPIVLAANVLRVVLVLTLSQSDPCPKEIRRGAEDRGEERGAGQRVDAHAAGRYQQTQTTHEEHQAQIITRGYRIPEAGPPQPEQRQGEWRYQETECELLVVAPDPDRVVDDRHIDEHQARRERQRQRSRPDRQAFANARRRHRA